MKDIKNSSLEEIICVTDHLKGHLSSQNWAQYIGFQALKWRCKQYGYCGQNNLLEWENNILKSDGMGNVVQSGSKKSIRGCLGVAGHGPNPYPFSGPLNQKPCWGCFNLASGCTETWQITLLGQSFGISLQRHSFHERGIYADHAEVAIWFNTKLCVNMTLIV